MKNIRLTAKDDPLIDHTLYCQKLINWKRVSIWKVC